VLERCISAKVYLKYPDPNYSSLRRAVAEYADVDESNIAVLNGAAEALHIIPLVLRARSIITVEPTFGDYELLHAVSGIELRRVVMDKVDGKFVVNVDKVVDEARRAPKPSMVVLSVPNNPTGQVLPLKALEDMVTRLPANTVLVLDEAFIRLCTSCTDLDVASLVDNAEVIRVRSLTKELAAPGLRLGYVVAHHSMLWRIDGARQPWPIDAVTECVYTRLLTEYLDELTSYLERARQLVREELQWLSSQLASLGLEVFESHAPYVLVRHEECRHPVMQKLLIKHGVYVRDASTFYGLDTSYSRVSVRTRDLNGILVQAMLGAMKACGVEAT
jgi:histidinol-phosphate aminotransferase/threonine-phosphate decarboxylase